MDYFKQRWSSGGRTPPAEIPPNQSQTVEQPYNSVTYSNSHSQNGQKPIIISTHHPGQISIIHEVRNPSVRAAEMASPTDSFHSVVSTYQNDSRDGKVNMAFNNNGDNMNSHNHRQQNQSQLPPNQ